MNEDGPFCREGNPTTRQYGSIPDTNTSRHQPFLSNGRRSKTGIAAAICLCLSIGAVVAYSYQNEARPTGEQTTFASKKESSLSSQEVVRGEKLFLEDDAQMLGADVTISTTNVTGSHLVFIMVDDMGHNDIGYATTDLKYATMNLDHLSEKGIILNRYYTQQSCTPARVAFLTGRYPINVGMAYDARGSFTAVSPYGVPLDVKLLPEYLNNHGYRTTMVGKWNIGHFEENYLPHRRGFESALSFQSDEMHYSNYTIQPRLGDDNYAPVDMLLAEAGEPFLAATMYSGYSTQVFTDRAVDMINLQPMDARPMFLYLAYQAVHVPHDTPPYELVGESDEWKLENVSDQGARYHFAKTLIALDKAVKRIIDTLESANMLENSFVFVASDNGGCPSDGSNNYPLRGGKFDLFEGGVHVPSFIYSPLLPTRMQGTKYNNLFHAVDWAPTLLQIADPDMEIPTNLDGVSHIDYFLGTADESLEARTEVLLGLNRWDVSPTFQPRDLSFMQSSGAVIYDNWKFVKSATHRSWYEPRSHAAHNCTCGLHEAHKSDYLFDLKNDPLEYKNVIGERHEIAAMMKLKLRAYYDNATKTQWRAPEQDVAVAEWSRSGGYLVPWHRPGSSVSETLPGIIMPSDGASGEDVVAVVGGPPDEDAEDSVDEIQGGDKTPPQRS